ncbi:MAG TPA: 50S ribosomal protein L9 [Saprospiraceae bacterium]|nr:50S ribosomal protein L9 [Saprospiraceae bacterium]HMP24303.1 50S ribosomal protein L9 [Saprospiraceae bacterium]
MEIILLKDIEKVGEKHTIVTVKDGYGRNYLIPQGFALVANATNRGKLDDLKRREAEVESKVIAEYQVIADKIKDVVLRIGAKAGASGKLFGSVTNIQIAAALKDQAGVEIERKKILIDEEIKTLGTYTAVLDLHKKVDAKVQFEVVGE